MIDPTGQGGLLTPGYCARAYAAFPGESSLIKICP